MTKMLTTKAKKNRRNLLYVFIGVVIGIIYCFYHSHITRFNDQKLHVKIADTIELFSVSTIEYGITGKNKLKYTPELTYNDNEFREASRVENGWKTSGFGYVGEDSSRASLEYKSKQFTLFADAYFLETDSALVAFVIDILKDNKIDLKMSVENWQGHKKLDTTITIFIKIPPISNVNNIAGENIRVSNFDFLKWKNKIKQQIPSVNERFINKGATICELLRRNYIRSHFDFDPIQRITYDNYDDDMVVMSQVVPVVNKSVKNIEVSLEVDTIYYKTAIVGYYSGLDIRNINKYDLNKKIAFDDVILRTTQYYNSFDITKIGNRYFLGGTFTTSFGTGLIGIYLVNIDKSGSYFIQEIANYITDNSPPEFCEKHLLSRPDDFRYEGSLCIKNEDYQGHYPYNMPFTGIADGDIKEIYFDGMKINFEKGKEFFFRKKMYLETGYNRIPIKTTDNHGNVGEYFIPITMGEVKE